MSDEPFNLVLEHLKALRADMAALRGILGEHGERLSRIDIGVSRYRRDQAEDAETVVHMEVRPDRLRDDIEMIKPRLDLRDA
jgi:hypothetical protein